MIRTKREIAPRAPFPTIEGEHDGAVLEQFREGNWLPEDIGKVKSGALSPTFTLCWAIPV